MANIPDCQIVVFFPFFLSIFVLLKNLSLVMESGCVTVTMINPSRQWHEAYDVNISACQTQVLHARFFPAVLPGKTSAVMKMKVCGQSHETDRAIAEHVIFYTGTFLEFCVYLICKNK